MGLLRKYKSLYSSTSNSFGTGTGVTITPSSVVGLPTSTEILLTFDRVNSSGVATPSLMERIIGSISAGNLAVRTSPGSGRGADSSTEQAHTSPVVEMIWNAKDWNDLIDWALVEHGADGVHDATILMKLAGTQTVTGAKTFGAGLLISTSALLTTPKVITSLNDTNGNEVFKITATASAVNEATLINGATGSNVGITMSGGDTDVGLDLRMKGAGRFRRPTIVQVPVVGAASDMATGDGKAFFRIPAELNGMNLTGVNGSNATAGVTGTNDTQIRRNRSGSDVDMLSTKITIDSTEVDTSTAATPAVINTSNDDVQTGDRIFFDIDAIQTTPAKGLVIEMRFELP